MGAKSYLGNRPREIARNTFEVPISAAKGCKIYGRVKNRFF